MGNRVYYGEYTLKHWLDLMLKKNIVLPEYQRYFVWDENRVKTLIETFNKDQFVPSNNNWSLHKRQYGSKPDY